MKLHMSQGDSEYSLVLEAAVKAWNDVLGRDVIELSKDTVDYPYSIALGLPGDREFYNDGTSVIYFVNRSNSTGGYVLTWHNAGLDGKIFSVAESDVFIWTRDGLTEGLGFNGTVMHELGHALGLAHIPISERM